MSIPQENTSTLLLYNVTTPYSDIWVNFTKPVIFETKVDLNKSIIAF